MADLIWGFSAWVTFLVVNRIASVYWAAAAGVVVAHGSLTLIVFGSVAIGRPFTEPYAREQAPEAVWHDPKFLALNRQISLMWGLAFLVGTISLIVAGASGDRQILLRLVVPFGALAWAYTYTQRKAAAVDRSDPVDAARP
jgi:hypothetical protein